MILPEAGDGHVSGTWDHEVAAAIPCALLLYVKEHLFKTCGEFNMGYPDKKTRGTNRGESYAPMGGIYPILFLLDTRLLYGVEN